VRGIFVFLCSVFCAQAAFAGAWLQPKGDGLFIGQATYFASDNFFDADGVKQKQPQFSKEELQPYAEYGLLDNLTIGGTAFAQRDEQSGTSNYGVADPEIFARSVVWRDSVQLVSVQPLLKFHSAFGSDDPPRGGSSSTDEELALLYGRSLHVISDRDYLDLRGAYRLRGGALNNQWQADAAIGLQVAPRWQIIPAIRGVLATKINDRVAFSENGDLDYDLLKAEVTAAYHLDEQRWLQLCLFDHLAGVETGDGYGVSVGFAQRF
jgi:hypothetical protein